MRNKLFDLGILSSKEFNTPLICVGNLSVGGTGKTPMVEYLIRYFQKEYKVAVLSRGYKRKSHGFFRASNHCTVEDLGDEPFQIHSKFSKVIVAVDADRQHGIAQLEKDNAPDVILLDDAFQHRKVTAHVNILLTTYDNLYVDDWYLPTGNLRDSKSQARRANYVVVTKCPIEITEKECETIKKKLALKNGQQLLFSYLNYNEVLKSEDKTSTLEALKAKNITVVTGIANPKPFIEYLKSKALNFNHLSYRDHYYFSDKEIEMFNSKEVILTTEKDFMRLKGRVKNLFYLEVSHCFLGDGEKVLQEGLGNFMKQISYSD